jgi:hypothetical protein
MKFKDSVQSLFDLKGKEYSPTFEHIEIDRKNIIMALGYGKNQPPPYVSELIEELLEEVSSKAKLKSGFRIYPIESVNQSTHSLVINQISFDMDKMIYGLLKKSDYIAIFTVTVGKEFSNWYKSFVEEGDPLKSYLVDTIGSETAELTADFLEEDIRQLVALNNLRVTNRYSPGYCNWHVREQHKLFSLLPKKFCGISLKPSGLMVPIKSVSGMIGIGRNVRKMEYQCSICSQENCYKREHFKINH